MTLDAAAPPGGQPTDLVVVDGREPEETRTAGRWELLRALGALVLDPPDRTASVVAALSLPLWTTAEHTGVFVLSLPPHAAVYLGPDGMLGGEGADRVAGVWRALGVTPPENADHLGVILALYAETGEAAQQARLPLTRERLDHVRATVLWEHLWPWVPCYLDAVRRESEAARPWADLLARVLERETALTRPPVDTPLGLRNAPPGIDADTGVDGLLTALTTPVRAGFILTGGDLAEAARRLGLGLRRGERRFVLRALLEQDATATLAWLAGHARHAARGHQQRADQARGHAEPGRQAAGTTDRWWAARARWSAVTLKTLACEAHRRSQHPRASR